MPYAKNTVPRETQELPRYLDTELDRVALESATLTPNELYLQPLAADPARPRDGQLVYADGDNWDPGAGKGVYLYDGTSWLFLNVLPVEYGGLRAGSQVLSVTGTPQKLPFTVATPSRGVVADVANDELLVASDGDYQLQLSVNAARSKS